MEARWRTWMFHSLFAAVLGLIFGALPVLVLFGAREIEQAFTAAAAGFENDWVDHFADFAAPFTVIVIMSSFGLIG